MALNPQPAALDATCVECGGSYAVTAAEQTYYRERGLPVPTRCPACRAVRRAARNAELLAAHSTGDRVLDAGSLYGGYGGGGGGSGGRPAPRGGPRGRGGPRLLFRATCAACGADTEVPFEPRGDRPVYCSACFATRRGR